MTLRDLLPPLERPLLGFDLETTHTNKKIARIVQLGLEIMVPGQETRKYETYVNPGIPIPPIATHGNIKFGGHYPGHGITDDMVKDAPTFEALADNLLKGFANADFGGYNIRFDLRILAAEFKRAQRAWNYEAARIVDFFRVWQVLEARSLDDAMQYWIGQRLAAVKPALAAEFLAEIAAAGKSHGAMRDVLASTRVGMAQMMVSDTMPRDLQALHDLCWPGWFDAEGKFQWRDGELCIMFGEHREETIRQVPRSYLHWIAYKAKDFDERVRNVCKDAIKGIYPTQPSVSGGTDEDLET